jgi:hypothetical protein
MSRAPVIEQSDNRKAIVFTIVMFLLTLFLLFFIKFHEPDPPKVTIPIPITMADEGIENFEIHNAGGGAPSEQTVEETQPEPTPQEQPVQEESTVAIPTGTGDTDSDASTTSETTQEAPNPFSGSGSGGAGSAGQGTGFGPDSGPGSGSGEPGSGAAGERIRLTNLKSNPKTPNSSICKIALQLTVDERGVVVAANVVRAQTTTTNQVLIDEVIDLVRKEVRYKEKPGARHETAYFTVTVQPG